MSNFGNNVNEYYVDAVRSILAERSARLRDIRTSEDAAAYVAEIRRKIKGIFRFPERTPLEPVVTGSRTYGDVRVDNLYFYSRPHFPVTANFYRPEKAEAPLPGILFLCGHAIEGKGAQAYRLGAMGLAKKGFSVLIIDPIDQGERHQFLSEPEHTYALCANHNILGKRLLQYGEWFGSWRTWDAVRGLDYLASRPEVDASRLGVTGNSGGGTLTTWMTAVDERLSAAAPSCYITTWRHNVENELPADFEQMPPRALELGLDMGDFLLANAPRDTLILGQEKDFFDPRGTLETFEDVRRINGLLGGGTQVFIGPTTHGYSLENRQAMYAFFTKRFLGREDGAEPDMELPPMEETYAASGDIGTIPGQKWVMQLADELAAAAPKPEPGKLPELLAVGKASVPYYRTLRPMFSEEKKIFAMRYGLETEPGRVMSVLRKYSADALYNVKPEKTSVRLYIPHLDAASELADRNLPEQETLYALDIRGVGEMTADGADQPVPRNFFHPYQADYHYAALSLMLGRPYLGGKVRDILCAVELLASQGALSITLEAKGLGCIPARIAAGLTDKITSLELTELPEPQEKAVARYNVNYPLSYVISRI